jgi:hypothetical protein
MASDFFFPKSNGNLFTRIFLRRMVTQLASFEPGLITTASRIALGPTQPPIQWVPGVLSLGVKWSGREADHSPSSSAEVKECVEMYLHSPNTPSWHGA